MAGNTRNTKWAVVAESTEGTPVSPSSATDYVSLTDGGFELNAEFESITNESIQASIGSSKPITGFESPQGSWNSYLKASSVEGTPPESSLFIKSLFGSEHDRATERDTVGGSTAGTSSARATLVVNTGEGAEFARGHIVLIKDATNGYSIRHVYSVSSDTLSLGFNLGAAPASGVNLGLGVTYMPTNSGHTSLSVWDYRGDGWATQMASGCQVSEMSIEANAGELVTADYTFEGLKAFFDPVEVTASTDTIDFDDGGVKAVTLTNKIYRTPIELAAEVQSKMDAASSDTITCTYSSVTGKYTIATNGAALSLLWNTGANTAQSAATKLGFTTAADSTAALTYTSPNAITLSAPQTPSLDSSSPIVAKNLQLIVGSFSETVCVEEGVQSFSATVSVEKPKTPDLCSESGRGGSVANARTVTGSAVLTIAQYDAQKFHDFANNVSRSIQFTFGEKDAAGNWTPGKSGSFYCPDIVYTTHTLSDSDGIITLQLDFAGHVDSSGNGEVYLGFV